MQFIDIGIEKIDKIFHVADVHVRNVNRHKEYVYVLISYIHISKRIKLKIVSYM